MPDGFGDIIDITLATQGNDLEIVEAAIDDLRKQVVNPEPEGGLEMATKIRGPRTLCRGFTFAFGAFLCRRRIPIP